MLWIAYAYWFVYVYLGSNALKDGADKLLATASNVASNAATDIDIQIKYLKEQPGLISASTNVVEALSKGGSIDLSSIDYERRKTLLNNNPAYHQLSLYFDDLEHKLNVNQIYLVDKSGTSVASSNWNLKGTSIGTNYRDRLNFIRGQTGLSTVQYSMGRTTHVPGLFFSTPIFKDKQFLGLIVIKVDLEELAQYRSSANTFLVDDNQVIVASHDKRFNLQALSDTAIKGLSSSELMSLYLADQIQVINIQKWSRDEPTLVKILDSDKPYVIAAKSLNEYSMNIYVAEPFDMYYEIISTYRYVFIAVSVIGAMLILLLALLMSYITNIKKTNHVLWYRANHDTLTGLPNLSFMLDSVKKLKSLIRFNSHCLVYIDIDRFREINDRLGHEVGDALIREFAARIRTSLPHDSLLCHLGGDRFAVLILQEADTVFARDICLKIQDSLHAPFRLNGSLIFIKSTMAYHLFSSKHDFLNKVLLQTELLVKELRRSKESRISECTKEFSDLQARKLEIKNSFSRAIDSNQFIPYFQPIINLRTRKIEKAELLIRWQHPDFGLLNPNEFIAIAEQSGSILKIGIWCRNQAIKYCKDWVELLNTPFQISINKSPIELMDADLESSIDQFVRQVHSAGLSGSNFAFEITESTLVQESLTAIQKINEIVQSGIKLSIDDFGTGFSSLSYLNRFPINSIKLDISFIANLKPGSSEEVVCGHMIDMAHKLGIAVIAEGVQTAEQEAILINLGCDFAQGFIYSPPLNAEDFQSLLQKNGASLK